MSYHKYYDNRRANAYICTKSGKKLVKIANQWTVVLDITQAFTNELSNPLIYWKGPISVRMKDLLNICSHKGAGRLKICPTCKEIVRCKEEVNIYE